MGMCCNAAHCGRTSPSRDGDDMGNKVLQPLLAMTFDHLLKTIGRNPEGVALCHEHRGAWIVWSWRNVVAAADRYASGLHRHEVEPGSAAALAGEISPNLVIATLAARISGASLLSIAPDAKASGIHEALPGGADHPAGLAVVQGRRRASRLSSARRAGLTPRSPKSSVPTRSRSRLPGAGMRTRSSPP